MLLTKPPIFLAAADMSHDVRTQNLEGLGKRVLSLVEQSNYSSAFLSFATKYAYRTMQ